MLINIFRILFKIIIQKQLKISKVKKADQNLLKDYQSKAIAKINKEASLSKSKNKIFYQIIRIYLKYKSKSQIQNKIMPFKMHIQYLVVKFLKKISGTEIIKQLKLNIKVAKQKVKQDQ